MKKLNLILIASIFAFNCQCQIKTCTINGKVVGRSSTLLYLTEALDRPDRPIKKIAITDSTFTFELDAHPIKAYWLVFEDEFGSPTGLHPVIFFPDQERISLILYDLKRIDKNMIVGGKLNKQFTDFKNKLKSKYDPLLRGKYSNSSLDSIQKERHSWCYKYYDQNPTIVSYYLILDELTNGFNISAYDEKYSDLQSIKYLAQTFSTKYPDHPYNKRSNDLIASYDKIKVGGEFIDFTLPDLNGNNINLSGVIKGKIALIDLWATWCGPCIKTSRSMVPVYNDFKDLGFTILGVANEIDNIDQLKKTLQREKFPWLNLIEINNQNRIWTKYGIANAGGGTFLVDNNGIILAINPSAEEVRRILIKKLK